MTKLVLYTENYFPGGLERFIFDFLESKTFDIHIIANSENIRVIDFAKTNNIDYSIINLSGLRLLPLDNGIYNKIIKIFNFFIYYFSMIPNYYKIKKVLIKSIEYKNILIVNGGYPAALSSLAAALASKKLGFKKVGLSILSSPSPYYSNGFFRFFQLKIDHYVGQYIDLYIPNSKKIKLDLIKRVNIKPEKINVVYTGVDILENTKKVNNLKINNLEIEKNDNDIWITMPALLGSTKRQDILIDALSRLDTNYKLLLAGDGPNKDVLKKQVKSLGIEERVVFLGWVSNTQDLYLFADLVVFISEQEGLPYVISEAMSYNVPIIASSVGGVPEQIIDTKGGLLLYDNNIDTLVEKINYLANEKGIIEEFTKYSFERLKENFSIATMNKKIFNLYK